MRQLSKQLQAADCMEDMDSNHCIPRTQQQTGQYRAAELCMGRIMLHIARQSRHVLIGSLIPHWLSDTLMKHGATLTLISDACHMGETSACSGAHPGRSIPKNSKKRHSLPLRVMLRTTLRENTELGMANTSRSKLRMSVRYQPTSMTMPSTACNQLQLVEPDLRTHLPGLVSLSNKKARSRTPGTVSLLIFDT